MGYLIRLEYGRISIENRISQAYNVLNGLFAVQIGVDSCTKAVQSNK